MACLIPKGTKSCPLFARNRVQTVWVARVRWPTMNSLHEYQVSFLDVEGILLEDVAVLAESLSIASDRARAIGAELGAAKFYLTSVPDEQTYN